MTGGSGDFLVLALAWALWCFLHSALIALPVTAFWRRHLGRGWRFYRLAYNLFALATLLPVLWLTRNLRGDPFFAWEGWLVLLRGLLVFGSLFFFLAGSRQYSLGQFLGLRPAAGHTGFRSDGILRVTRHPWYLGALLLLWSASIDRAMLVTNSVLSLYLVIGTVLEERKLVAEFGESYRTYQREVSMLLPIKWIRSQRQR